jgi:hypothetical protein
VCSNMRKRAENSNLNKRKGELIPVYSNIRKRAENSNLNKRKGELKVAFQIHQ